MLGQVCGEERRAQLTSSCRWRTSDLQNPAVGVCSRGTWVSPKAQTFLIKSTTIFLPPGYKCQQPLTPASLPKASSLHPPTYYKPQQAYYKPPAHRSAASTFHRITEASNPNPHPITNARDWHLWPQEPLTLSWVFKQAFLPSRACLFDKAV